MIEADNTKAKIRQRAYELYLQRGRSPGHELEDWLQAERELMERGVEKMEELVQPQVPQKPVIP